MHHRHQGGYSSVVKKNTWRLRWGLILYIVTAVLALPKWIEAVPSAPNHQNSETSSTSSSSSFVDSVFLSKDEKLIQDYLKGQTPSLHDFHIQGWRWHTMSLVREAERLLALAKRFQRKSVEERQPLVQATDYVIGFNLKGLHKIEADLFFPWMKKKLTEIKEPKQLSKSFEKVMNQLEADRKTVAKLGEYIVSEYLWVFFSFLFFHLKFEPRFSNSLLPFFRNTMFKLLAMQKSVQILGPLH